MDNNNLYLPCYADNDDVCLNGSTRGIETYLCIKWVHSQGPHYCGGLNDFCGLDRDSISDVLQCHFINRVVVGSIYLLLVYGSKYIWRWLCPLQWSAMASQITSLTIVYPSVYSRRRSKENIKAPRHWSLWGEFTGDRWIPAQRDSNAKMFPFDDVIMHLINFTHCRMWYIMMSKVTPLWYVCVCLFVVRVNLISNTQFPISKIKTSITAPW